MSIRVKVANGVLVPLEPLPSNLKEGEEFEVAKVNGFSMTAQSAPPAGEDEASGSDWLTDEESAALQDHLNEIRRLGKEQMRKVMELSE
jgi:predicted DNA-binding antitoxin AbrB/MazE fold protein